MFCTRALLFAAAAAALAAPARSADPEPKFKGTAEELTKEVLADPPATAKKYDKATVQVDGIVVAPGKYDPKGALILAGATGKFTMTPTNVRCVPPKGATLPPIATGKKVRVTGKVQVLNVTAANLVDCTVTELKDEK